MNHTCPGCNGNRHLHDGDQWLQGKHRHLHQLGAQPWYIPRYSKHHFISGCCDGGPRPWSSAADLWGCNNWEFQPMLLVYYNPNWIILLCFWLMTFNFLILLSITIVNRSYTAADWGSYPEDFTHAEISDLLLRGRCKKRLHLQVQHHTLKGIICHFLCY